MAAYIDLNPVRAGIVEDPKDYRWCGYAQTVAGDNRAKEGMGIVVGYFRNEAVTRADVILRSYRVHLYMEGEEKGAAETAVPARADGDGVPERSSADIQAEAPALRKGFSREAIAEVIANKGRSSRGELLRCRVRYFVDGVVIGSKAFVDEVFASNRSRFGPNWVDGGRRLRHCREKLYAMRDLQRDPVATRSTGEGAGR